MPADRMVKTDQHVAQCHVRMLKRFRDGRDLCAGNAGRNEPALPFVGIVRAHGLADERIQLVLVGLPVLFGRKARIVDPFRMPQHFCRRRPELASW